MEELLTVIEVANAVGKTTQAIYKQLATNLQPYVVKENNRTMLKKSVLTEYFKIDLPEDEKTVGKIDGNEVDSILQLLKDQLVTKDNQIEKLTTELIELNKKLVKLQENSQTLQLKMIENDKKEAEKIEGKIEDVTEGNEISPQVEEVKFKKSEKKGLFSRIFNV